MNKPVIILSATTPAVPYTVEDAAQLAGGMHVHGLALGIDRRTIEISGTMISRFYLLAAAIAGGMAAALALLFRFPSIGPAAAACISRGRDWTGCRSSALLDALLRHVAYGKAALRAA